MKKTKKKAKKKARKRNPAKEITSILDEQPLKNRRLKLSIAVSGGPVETYPLDSSDFTHLLEAETRFIEIPTREVPGVRFVRIEHE